MAEKRYVVLEKDLESGGGQMLKFFKDQTKALEYSDNLNREQWRKNLRTNELNWMVDWDEVKAELEQHQIFINPDLSDEELSLIFRKVEELSHQDYYPFGFLLNYCIIEVIEQ